MSQGIATGANLIGRVPFSTDIKTGMYTIPAGKHALIKCLSASDSAFTVDSGSGAVVAEEKTHHQHVQITSGSTTTAIQLPSTVDFSMWDCFLTFTTAPGVRVHIMLHDNTQSSINQFYPHASWKGGTQISDVNEAHDNIPSGISTIVSITANPFRVISSSFVYVINASSGFTLATTYSTLFSAERIRTGTMYESIVPAGTILNGDRYSVTLYNN